MPFETQEIALKLSGLTKRYGDTPAVDDLNLTVKKGELFGFLGPNGAGKTTTIKMMTGLLEPSYGKVEIGDIDIWKHPLEAKSKIAYVPDEPHLFPKLTGREFLRFVGSVYQMQEEKFERKAGELLEQFNLAGRVDELIDTYSHGMKQKISLCAALMHSPEVLFLDEPTVGLDPRSARTLKTLLRDLCKQGSAVFLSTHILEIAEQMCDQIGIIQGGKLIALGNMENLRPQDGKEKASLEDIFLQLTGGNDALSLNEETEG